ncbi:MAG: NAD(P)/FAD-dependent oxidoreductase [Clostridia bacterium]|nr:NAD(P)/FAD-dependent oxidoreductase [Clostridia bacterium]MBR2908546.1 NAD(P)/FAD-dependent oxidoreductase [Clostridia bacterium]
MDGKKVIIIGGGASGMLAAVHASYTGASVILIDRNERLGVKLRITGKGRCNVTNDCDREEFLRNVPRNPRFLYAALARFSPADTQSFFEMIGVPLKVERGRRVFPVSDKANDVANALVQHCRDCGVRIVRDKVRSIAFETLADGKKRAVGVVTEKETIAGDAVIVATGGKSYPRTGSDGDGYRFARAAGHTVTEIAPSLVPIVAEGRLCASLQGLSLKNVTLRMFESTEDGARKQIFEDFGEMMFTHFGLTGPLVLSASAHLDGIYAGKYTAEIDLKPALDDKTLDERIRSDFTRYRNRDLINALSDLLPQKLIAPIVSLSGIGERRKVHEITREERLALGHLLKHLTVKISGFRPIDEAIVTRGGVSVREIDPKTMQSKLVSGLYFAGEVLDLDAYTGGYNLQIAFATGVLAGESAAE